MELRWDSSYWLYPQGILHQTHLPEKYGPCRGPDPQWALMDGVLWLTPQAPDPEQQRPEEDSSKHLLPLKIAGWDLHPERARAQGLHSSSLRLKQHTDLNVSRATFKEISFRIGNEECEATHLVVSLMLLHLIFENLIFIYASLTKIMLRGTASVLLIINKQPKIHGMYRRDLQLGSCITS